MRGLVPHISIHVAQLCPLIEMAGTSPAMTMQFAGAELNQ
jgi:hypothetical protein